MHFRPKKGELHFLKIFLVPDSTEKKTNHKESQSCKKFSHLNLLYAGNFSILIGSFKSCDHLQPIRTLKFQHRESKSLSLSKFQWGFSLLGIFFSDAVDFSETLYLTGIAKSYRCIPKSPKFPMNLAQMEHSFPRRLLDGILTSVFSLSSISAFYGIWVVEDLILDDVGRPTDDPIRGRNGAISYVITIF